MFDSWVRKIPWWREWLANPVLEEPGGLQSIRSQRVGHDWATNTFSKYCPSEWIVDCVKSCSRFWRLEWWIRYSLCPQEPHHLTRKTNIWRQSLLESGKVMTSYGKIIYLLLLLLLPWNKKAQRIIGFYVWVCPFVLLTFVLSYQVSWVVDTRDNLQMQSVLKFAHTIKVQIRLPRSKSMAM